MKWFVDASKVISRGVTNFVSAAAQAVRDDENFVQKALVDTVEALTNDIITHGQTRRVLMERRWQWSIQPTTDTHRLFPEKFV